MSTLKVNTIQNASGGNASTTDNIQQGIAKAWVNFNGGGTLTSSDQTGVRNSFNVSSVIDNGTGDYTVTFATEMANANYTLAQGFPPINTSSFSGRAFAVPRSRDTSKVNIEIIGDGGSAFDSNYVELAVFGAN